MLLIENADDFLQALIESSNIALLQVERKGTRSLEYICKNVVYITVEKQLQLNQ